MPIYRTGGPKGDVIDEIPFGPEDGLVTRLAGGTDVKILEYFEVLNKQIELLNLRFESAFRTEINLEDINNEN